MGQEEGGEMNVGTVGVSVMELAIVRHAEEVSKKKHIAIWAVVAEFLACGSTLASEFCTKHLPANGWIETKVKQPESDKIIYAVEDIGDQPHKMMFSQSEWWHMTGKKKDRQPIRYVPKWWKPL